MVKTQGLSIVTHLSKRMFDLAMEKTAAKKERVTKTKLQVTVCIVDHAGSLFFEKGENAMFKITKNVTDETVRVV